MKHFIRFLMSIAHCTRKYCKKFYFITLSSDRMTKFVNGWKWFLKVKKKSFNIFKKIEYSCNTFHVKVLSIMTSSRLLTSSGCYWSKQKSVRNGYWSGWIIRRRSCRKWFGSMYRWDNNTGVVRSRRNNPGNGTCCIPADSYLQKEQS